MTDWRCAEDAIEQAIVQAMSAGMTIGEMLKLMADAWEYERNEQIARERREWEQAMKKEWQR